MKKNVSRAQSVRTTRLFALRMPNVRLMIVVLVAVAVFGTAVYFSSRAGKVTYTYNKSTNTSSGRLFTEDSPLNQAIPSDVRYRADGVNRLKTAGLPPAISLFEWSVPVFDADASTPKVNIWCYLTDIQASWNTCNGINLSPQPVPQGVFPQRGGDRHLIIIDNSGRKIYNYWIWKDCFLTFNPNNARWCPASGNVASIDGNGVGGASNVAKLAGGIIRTYEIERGYIDHAIAFSTATTCKGDPVYPALNSDGTNVNQSTCIPIGSRIQLDPSINVDALTNITPMEKMIAKALQKYGAYANDTSGIFGFSVEFDRTGRKVYQKAGAPETDHFALKGIPWDKVKIVEPQWNKDGSKAYTWGGGLQSTSSPAPTTSSTSSPTTTPTSTPTPSTPTPSTPSQSVTVSPQPTCDPAAKTRCSSPSPTPTPKADIIKPSAPSNLNLKIEFDAVKFSYYTNLSWSPSYDNVGVASYEVRRNDQTRGTTKTTVFKDYDLTADVSYRYEVYARDAAGNISSPGEAHLVGRCFLVWCWAE